MYWKASGRQVSLFVWFKVESEKLEEMSQLLHTKTDNSGWKYENGRRLRESEKKRKVSLLCLLYSLTSAGTDLCQLWSLETKLKIEAETPLISYLETYWEFRGRYFRNYFYLRYQYSFLYFWWKWLFISNQLSN